MAIFPENSFQIEIKYSFIFCLQLILCQQIRNRKVTSFDGYQIYSCAIFYQTITSIQLILCTVEAFRRLLMIIGDYWWWLWDCTTILSYFLSTFTVNLLIIFAQSINILNVECLALHLLFSFRCTNNRNKIKNTMICSCYLWFCSKRFSVFSLQI